MSRARWECPNGCAGVLGPTRPALGHVCRFCLACSAQGERMVRRVPAAAVRQRAAKDAAKREAAVAERARRAQLEIERRRLDAADYHVRIREVASGAITPIAETDDLAHALRLFRALRRDLARTALPTARAAELHRVKGGETATVVLHGAAFAGWEFEGGRREAS